MSSVIMGLEPVSLVHLCDRQSRMWFTHRRLLVLQILPSLNDQLLFLVIPETFYIFLSFRSTTFFIYCLQGNMEFCGITGQNQNKNYNSFQQLKLSFIAHYTHFKIKAS